MRTLLLLPFLALGCQSDPIWSHAEVMANYDTLQSNLWCPMEIKSGGYRVVLIDGRNIKPPKTKHEN